ncbi:hypothetical protein Pla123a_06410 [Posidoniimonas polymericola]|uniref:Uncharacterized protein n=2 Tax=Posidoniimonas polymericola TaxID=2528002 RepID=A0A5C5ZEP4_9BACT|nr:hypothetical protein Pla123a_06410 [Posidoniimonas polymericola]
MDNGFFGVSGLRFNFSEGPGCFGHVVLIAIGIAAIIAITKWWL